jgi:hypothetical protein
MWTTDMKHYFLTLYNKNLNDSSTVKYVKSVPSGCSKEMANNMKIKLVGNHRVLPLLNIFNRQTFPRAKTHIAKRSKKCIHIAKAMPNIGNI